MEENFLLIGGCLQVDSFRALPKLYAVTFESNPRVVDELDLSANNKYLGPVTCIKRFQGKNVFLIGGTKFAMVIEWTGTHLCILNIIDEAHSGTKGLTIGSITGIETGINHAFTVCSDDSFINQIQFN